MTDQQLVLRVKAGEDWAFEELAARHGDLIDGKCSMRYAPGETADDFRQAALLGLFKAAKTYTAGRGTRFRSWASLCVQAELDTFLVTACRGKHRVLSDAARLEHPVSDDGVELRDLVPAPASADPCARLLAKEEFAGHVRVLTLGCSETEQTVVTRRLNGLSLIEAGQGIGTNPTHTADNALQRVRKKLAAAA